MATIKIIVNPEELEIDWGTEPYVTTFRVENVLEKDYGADGSTWDLISFYEDFEKGLKVAFETDCDFEAKWGAKKEIRYAEVERKEGKISIRISEETDSGYNLADTVFWESQTPTQYSCGRSAIRGKLGLPDDFDLDGFFEFFFGLFSSDNILWGVADADSFSAGASAFKELEGDISWEAFIEAIDKLEDEVIESSERRYQEFVTKAKEIMSNCLEFMEEREEPRVESFALYMEEYDESFTVE